MLILTEKGIKFLHHGDLLQSIADNSFSLKSLNLGLLVNLCDWKQREKKWNEKEKTGQALFLVQVRDMIRHTHVTALSCTQMSWSHLVACASAAKAVARMYSMLPLY